MANPEHVEIVKQGAEALRRWRMEHPNTHLDLSGADLRGAWLSEADLFEANLQGATLDDAVAAKGRVEERLARRLEEQWLAKWLEEERLAKGPLMEERLTKRRAEGRLARHLEEQWLAKWLEEEERLAKGSLTEEQRLTKRRAEERLARRLEEQWLAKQRTDGGTGSLHLALARPGSVRWAMESVRWMHDKAAPGSAEGGNVNLWSLLNSYDFAGDPAMQWAQEWLAKWLEEERLAKRRLAQEERLAKHLEEERLAKRRLAQEQWLAKRRLAQEERLAKRLEEQWLAKRRLTQEQWLAKRLAEERLAGMLQQMRQPMLAHRHQDLEPLTPAAVHRQLSLESLTPAAADRQLSMQLILELPTPAAGLPAAPSRGAFDPADTTVRDKVDCTLFAPIKAARGESFLVQVFVHLPEQYKAVKVAAKESDPGTKKRGSTPLVTSLGTQIARGSTLTFQLKMLGLSVEEPRQELVWRGIPSSVSFIVHVPRRTKRSESVSQLTVYQDGVRIGCIKFTLPLVQPRQEADASPAASDPLQPVGEAHRYKTAFISYASADRTTVLERVQMLRIVGIQCHQDLLDLDPGDRWARKLYLLIDDSHVLYLFWSTAAKKSWWVSREWNYGLRKKGLSFIQPVPIEGPPPVLPPRKLAKLHFNDFVLYLRAAEEQVCETGRSNP